MIAIQAVIFDMQGVLSVKAPKSGRSARKRAEAKAHVEAGGVDRALQAFKGNPVCRNALLEALGLQTQSQTCTDEGKRFWDLINENIEIARLLRGHYRIALLANSSGDLEKRLVRHGLRDLFEDVVESAAIGIRKPDPRIYEIAASRLGIDPRACLLVDDKEENVLGARRTGMQAVQYRHGRDDLGQILGRAGVRIATRPPARV